MEICMLTERNMLVLMYKPNAMIKKNLPASKHSQVVLTTVGFGEEAA